MTISEAITAVLQASHIDDQNFRQFLLGDDPEVVEMRQALVNLADAVRDQDEGLGYDDDDPRSMGWVGCDGLP